MKKVILSETYPEDACNDVEETLRVGTIYAINMLKEVLENNDIYYIVEVTDYSNNGKFGRRKI